ncbi:MAG: membrane protein insertion efficiency factor YidD [Bacteroidales bacterium]|nr:membrane protein insertion efficiency factor YidD [Bacteroidales bacterium]
MTGFASSGISQEKEDMERLKNLFPVNSKDKVISTQADWSNELKLILTVGFNVYKKYISTQDALNCAFYPSCSSYALETLKVNGFLGIFDAVDRLTRCNSFSPEKYHVHPTTHRFYDPIRKIH